jgi:hypothetical protein
LGTTNALSRLFAVFAEVNQRLVVVPERLKLAPAFDVGGRMEMEPVPVDADATNLSAFRPHPACPDGAREGGLDAPPPPSRSDPIRLVRMVKQIVATASPANNLIHHPHKADGVEIFE